MVEQKVPKLCFWGFIYSTGTFKIKKVDLQKEEFDIFKIKDPIYFLDSAAGEYVLLDEKMYEKIQKGEARV